MTSKHNADTFIKTNYGANKLTHSNDANPHNKTNTTYKIEKNVLRIIFTTFLKKVLKLQNLQSIRLKMLNLTINKIGLVRSVLML